MGKTIVAGVVSGLVVWIITSRMVQSKNEQSPVQSFMA